MGFRPHSNHDRSSSGVRRCQSLLQQHRWTWAPWPRCPWCALLCFSWFQACCWCFPGHYSCSHGRTARPLWPTFIVTSPAQASIYHAARRRILETDVRIMPLRWVLLAWCRIITFPHVWFCLTPCYLPQLWTWERSMFLLPGTKAGDGAVFHTVLQSGSSCLHRDPLGLCLRSLA